MSSFLSISSTRSLHAVALLLLMNGYVVGPNIMIDMTGVYWVLSEYDRPLPLFPPNWIRDKFLLLIWGAAAGEINY